MKVQNTCGQILIGTLSYEEEMPVAATACFSLFIKNFIFYFFIYYLINKTLPIQSSYCSQGILNIGKSGQVYIAAVKGILLKHQQKIVCFMVLIDVRS